MNHVPPSDLDAEAAVLSAVLLDKSALDHIRGMLTPEDFYADANRRIFESALELDGAGKPTDIVTVGALLRERNRLAQVGGAPYLAQISDATPTIGHVEQHARIVRAKAMVRRVQAVCQGVAAEGYADTGDVTEWLQGVEARVLGATQVRNAEDTLECLPELVASEAINMQQRARLGHGITGIPTGFRSLDARIGGLKRGNLYTIAGRPGHGKTAFALCLATNAAERGYAVVFISIEMPREQLTQRAIAQQAGLDTGSVERARLSASEWSDAARASAILGKLPVAIDDAGCQTVPSVRAAVRRGLSKLRDSFGDSIQLGLVVVDYLQIMTPKERKGRTRENDVSELSSGLRALAKELSCPVVQLSQLSRECEKRPNKRPVLSDLRDSGSIEQDSFGIMFVYRDDMYRKDGESTSGEAEIIVRKMRQGGSTGTVRLAFQAHSTRFYELEREPDGYEGAFGDTL